MISFLVLFDNINDNATNIYLFSYVKITIFIFFFKPSFFRIFFRIRAERREQAPKRILEKNFILYYDFVC